MNCKLFLLLLGAFCTIGYVQAIKRITLDDAKRAINVAWGLYEGSNTNQPYYNEQMTMDNGNTVNVGCTYRANDRFDCGLPPFYQMSEDDLNALKEWFSQWGNILPPIKKGKNNNLIANAVVGKFNFHLEIEEELKFLMMLLSRLLQ